LIRPDEAQSPIEDSIEPHTRLVPLDRLLPGDSPRQEGENDQHIQMLAEVASDLPPILVHRQTMRVIDGIHRLAAARLQGEKLIGVRFFDGSEKDAFVLGVQANIMHGLPLSMADRRAAAARILSSHPNWSDRAVAEVAGLSPQAVASLRAASGGHPAQAPARRGRDGRTRPVDGAEGRMRVCELITSMPQISLRELARQAGVSPATARDVRMRIERGDDPVPPAQRRVNGKRVSAARNGRLTEGAAESDVASLLRGLQTDPALRFSESGRTLLRWVSTHAVRPGELAAIGGIVPAHCAFVLARLARHLATEWEQFAYDLEARTQQSA
jgi:hypothetical protein